MKGWLIHKFPPSFPQRHKEKLLQTSTHLNSSYYHHLGHVQAILPTMDQHANKAATNEPLPTFWTPKTGGLSLSLPRQVPTISTSPPRLSSIPVGVCVVPSKASSVRILSTLGREQLQLKIHQKGAYRNRLLSGSLATIRTAVKLPSHNFQTRKHFQIAWIINIGNTIIYS